MHGDEDAVPTQPPLISWIRDIPPPRGQGKRSNSRRNRKGDRPPRRVTRVSDSLIHKPLGALSLIGGALFGPYIYFSSQPAGGVRPDGTQASGEIFPGQATAPSWGAPSTSAMLSSNAGPMTGSAAAPAGHSAPAPVLMPDGSWGYVTAMPYGPNDSGSMNVPGGPSNSIDVREILRFDLTPAALPSRFPQVSRVRVDPQLDSYRANFSTGPQPTDLRGIVIYGFDAKGMLQRVQVQATTGDPSLLIQMMAQFYHLQSEPMLGSQLMLSRWNSRITSMLQIQAAEVLYQHDQHHRYQVFLELNQPSLVYSLSPEAQQRLAPLQPPPAPPPTAPQPSQDPLASPRA